MLYLENYFLEKTTMYTFREKKSSSTVMNYGYWANIFDFLSLLTLIASTISFLALCVSMLFLELVNKEPGLLIIPITIATFSIFSGIMSMRCLAYASIYEIKDMISQQQK